MTGGALQNLSMISVPLISRFSITMIEVWKELDGRREEEKVIDILDTLFASAKCFLKSRASDNQ